ncbi:MAG: addiction module protein [Bacteroidetes bacterium]|nr:addiction module protein [Bacteroidota bacterium]
MNLTLEKERIIEQLQQVKDVDLLKAVKSLLDFSLKQQIKTNEVEIPEWHKTIVRKRIAHAKKHPETLLSWDDVMNELDS